MDPKTLFAKSLEQASNVVRHVQPEQLDNDTPCTEWKMRQLLNHMVYELLWVPELVKGKTVAEIGDRYKGDVLHSDFHTAWQHAADAALVAVHTAKDDSTAHLSYGDIPMANYIQEVGSDIFIHCWDVGQGMYCTVLLNPEVAQAVYDNSLPRKQKFAESGLFGKPFEPPKSANLQTKLLALFGRKG